MNHITLITAFKQGTVEEGGNCASVALIKAAMDKYGVDRVFASYTKKADQHRVTLRDRAQLSFTDAELEQATAAANFELLQAEHQDIWNRANLYFCAMVKRVMQIGECGEGQDDFEDAIEALNDGADTAAIPKLLGLPHVSSGAWTPTRATGGVVAWNRAHAVFASNGVYDDRGAVSHIRLKFPNRLFLQ